MNKHPRISTKVSNRYGIICGSSGLSFAKLSGNKGSTTFGKLALMGDNDKTSTVTSTTTSSKIPLKMGVLTIIRLILSVTIILFVIKRVFFM